MFVKRSPVLILVFFIALFLSGCAASLQNAPSANDAQINAALKNPARVNHQVTKGGFVETFNLDAGQYVDVQINKYQHSSNSHAYSPDNFGYEQTLTVGHFSKVLGSGFSKKSNIFFKKKIRSSGQDTFRLGEMIYRVTWYLVDARYFGVYDVIIDRLK